MPSRLQRGSQSALQLQAGIGGALHLRLEHANGVAAGGLGPIERDVGAADDVGGIVVVAGEQRHADAGTHGQHAAVHGDGRGQPRRQVCATCWATDGALVRIGG